MALLEVGDTVMGMSLDHGGHLTHGSPVNASGRFYNFVSYGLDDDERIDYDAMRNLALKERPKLIVAGATAYSRRIDPEPFRKVCDEIGAYFMFDAAHIAGLIAGGQHPNPIPLADVMTFTTHKTLRGPRGGCILSSEALAKKIDSAVFPGNQGGTLDNVNAAKAVGFREALDPGFANYAARIVENANALAGSLIELGFRLVSGGTDNHLLLVDLRSFDEDLTGKEAQEILDIGGVTLNRNTESFSKCDLVPTILASVGEPDMSTKVFGQKINMPLFLSPTAMQRLYHHDGDKASARAAEKFGTFYSMSSMGNNSIEEISNISSGPKLFQLYVHKDRSISDDLIERSRRSGFDAMCLTVDTLVAGNREKDHRTGFTTPPKLTLQSLMSFAMRPGWVFNYFTGKRFELSNVKKKTDKGTNITKSVIEYINEQYDPALGLSLIHI